MFKRWTIVAAVIIILLVPAAVVAGPDLVRNVQQGRELAAVWQATAKYHNVNAAIADGYLPADHCVDRRTAAWATTTSIRHWATTS